VKTVVEIKFIVSMEDGISKEDMEKFVAANPDYLEKFSQNVLSEIKGYIFSHEDVSNFEVKLLSQI
jgi:hypothetical protein